MFSIKTHHKESETSQRQVRVQSWRWHNSYDFFKILSYFPSQHIADSTLNCKIGLFSLLDTLSKSKGKLSLVTVGSCDRQGEFYLGELRTSAKTCSHITTPSSTTAGGIVEQVWHTLDILHLTYYTGCLL